MKRNHAYDFLRIIAILGVLYQHRSPYALASAIHPDMPKNVIFQVLALLCRCAVPLFFMISGALLLGREEDIKSLFRKRVLRIFLVMLLCALIREIADCRILGQIPMTNPDGSIVWAAIAFYLECLFTKLNWYLYAYLAYLLMLPILRLIVKGMNRQISYYYMICVATFYSVQGILLATNRTFTTIDFAVLFNASFASMCWSIIFPIAGYLLTKAYQEKQVKSRLIWILGVGTILSVILGSFGAAADLQKGTGNFELIRLHALFFPCCFAYVGCLFLFEKVKAGGAFAKVLSFLSACTFGIFILETHSSLTVYSGQWAYQLGAKLSMGEYGCGLLAAFFQFLLCTAITAVLRLIPGLKKLL